jgi:hypothetical protein
MSDAEQYGRSRLTLTINGVDFSVRPIVSEDGQVRLSFRLTRMPAGSGAVFDVADTVHGPTCDRPDFVFRRDGLDPCGYVHGRAMRAVGIL